MNESDIASLVVSPPTPSQLFNAVPRPILALHTFQCRHLSMLPTGNAGMGLWMTLIEKPIPMHTPSGSPPRQKPIGAFIVQ